MLFSHEKKSLNQLLCIAQAVTAYFLSGKLAAFLAALVVTMFFWNLVMAVLLALEDLALRSFGVNFFFFHSSLAAPLLFSDKTVRTLAIAFLTTYTKKKSQEVILH